MKRLTNKAKSPECGERNAKKNGLNEERIQAKKQV